MSKVCRIGLLFSLILVFSQPVFANTLSPVEAMKLDFLSPHHHVTYCDGKLFTSAGLPTTQGAQRVGVNFVDGLGFHSEIIQEASFSLEVGVVMAAVFEQDGAITQHTKKGALELFDAQGELMLQASIHPGSLSREADDTSKLSFFATMTINGGWLYDQEIVTMGGPIYEPGGAPPAAIRLDLYDLLGWEYMVSPGFSDDYIPFLPGAGVTARASAMIYANPGPGVPKPNEPVPEPATAVLLLSGILCRLIRRH